MMSLQSPCSGHTPGAVHGEGGGSYSLPYSVEKCSRERCEGRRPRPGHITATAYLLEAAAVTSEAPDLKNKQTAAEP